MSSEIEIRGHRLQVSSGLVRTARLEQEWYEDVPDPAHFLSALRSLRRQPDIFTFWQRLPDVQPHFPHYVERDEIAALPISSYDHWWSTQIKSRTRGLIRKSQKERVVVREAEYTDDFVRGMTEIFNETPLRQGRPFWHYGKSFGTVKREFLKYLSREILIGAYLEDELIGFMMIGRAGRYALIGQIISKISHRDKGINNGLIAKAVEVCAREGYPYLVYLRWSAGSLSEFKRRNGFQRIALPRYFVPLTVKGRVALQLGLHKGLTNAIPSGLATRLKHLRAVGYKALYSVRHRNVVLADES